MDSKDRVNIEDKTDDGDNVSYLPPGTPPLCANGCGFFGSLATYSLCSKCYRDFILAKSAHNLACIENEMSPPVATSARALDSSRRQLSISISSEDKTRDTNVAASSSSSTVKNRCQSCKKKVGLTGFQCRCDGVFCGMHRYPEEHSCTFDYKIAGRITMMENNPAINGDKLQKRI